MFVLVSKERSSEKFVEGKSHDVGDVEGPKLNVICKMMSVEAGNEGH